ncbi:LysR family transcriptional regulator [Salinicoccus sp. ID82-1]|uniref:LysR family transcriptional regulator n=1 Tax=Salinicoccus cyprini TaxID=2493691 RepID=A0A558AR06_9STAP|nr:MULTISPECIES: LysR family transcriptional regulator [Salinicoccus]MCG1010247.1 LysR family transcriptional regulator [Salinicoccus sp. ID82-1]TVT26699.1 LysR family transcriptional regulator [Salinicoccus cyprini]
MKVDDYKLLVTLDETRTLRRAAEKLFISQPAVSQRLKSIEDEWGVKIFIRTKKELYVTGEGEKIIEHARSVVERETLVKEYIRINQNSIQGNLSIGVSSLIGHTILPEILAQYLKLYPNVNIKIKVGSSQQIIGEQNDFHISIVRGNQMLNKQNELLFVDRHYLVAPKENDDRSRLPIIEFQADPMYISEIEQFFEHRFSRKYDAQIKVDQIATCRALLLEGIGMTVLPEIVVEGFDEDRFNIDEVMVAGRPITRDTYIAFDRSVLELPQVEAFLTLVRTFVNAN